MGSNVLYGHLLAYYYIKMPGIKVAIHPSEADKGLNAYILRMLLEGNTILKIHHCAARLKFIR